jgi:hypothetical protein
MTCKEPDRFIVKPAVFKMNVVEHCEFEMKETVGQRSPTSPAVSGEGALNPYDIVPCMRLKSWPSFLRKKLLEMYHFQACDGTFLPLFVVPTGNPLSTNRDNEWRLSFAVLEIEIFRQLKAHQRRFYGLAKYVFKVVFEEQELIQSYHLKILFLRWLEDDDLVHAKPLSFLANFFKYVLDAVKKQFIPHLFIEDCNIYPVHYHTVLKETKFRSKIENENFESVVMRKIQEIISHDTKTELSGGWGSWLKRTNNLLMSRQERGISETWISGYLTRLLSVIAYCLRKSQSQDRVNHGAGNLVKLMQIYEKDKYIRRVISFILSLLKEVYCIDVFSKFETVVVMPFHAVSHVIHKAFYCYEKHDLKGVRTYLAEADAMDLKSDTIGVTVTKFHAGIDIPLDYVIGRNERDLNSNRFYLRVNVVCLHMKIQLLVRKLDNLLEGEKKDINANSLSTSDKSTDEVNGGFIRKGDSDLDKETGQATDAIMELVTELVNAVDVASVREPYTGKLSYQHVGSLLLIGYRKAFAVSSHQSLREIKPVSKTESSLFNKKELATNFDLR